MALYEILRASIGLLLPWGVRYFRDGLAAIRNIEVLKLYLLQYWYNVVIDFYSTLFDVPTHNKLVFFIVIIILKTDRMKLNLTM